MKQRIIDLTHPLVEGMPQYPGQDDARFCRRLDIDTDGVLMTSLCCCTHIGTHVDAPAHFIRGGLTMFEIPLDRWMGSALVLDVEPDANGAVGIGDRHDRRLLRDEALDRVRALDLGRNVDEA